MSSLVDAAGQLATAGLPRFAIIGGVAVSARLGEAHRATADVDTVVDGDALPPALETLSDLDGATRDPATP